MCTTSCLTIQIILPKYYGKQARQEDKKENNKITKSSPIPPLKTDV